MTMIKMGMKIILTMVILSIGACAHQEEISAKKQPIGYYKVGKPYKIRGKWYRPKENYSYRKTGVASWYGPKFHGKLTANGEIYDQYAMTAAHPNLPLPCVVRVTNLRNGRQVIVRVNDRGPYAHNRIIDLSKAAASKLGFLKRGTTKVRVEILPAPSKALKSYLINRKKYAMSSHIRNAQRHDASQNNYKDSTAGLLYVQFGRYTKLHEARAMLGVFGHYFDTEIVKQQSSSRDIYSLRIGPWPTMRSAENYVRSLKNFGFKNSKVIEE